MAVVTTRDALSRIFSQRCFWLFAVLLIVIGAVSFVRRATTDACF